MNKHKVPRTQSYMDVEVAPESLVKLGTDIKAKIGLQLRAMALEVVIRVFRIGLPKFLAGWTDGLRRG